MAVELIVPNVGESITEVVIGQWLKPAGQRVERDEPVVEIESDKATLEVAAPVSGIVSQVLKDTGATALVGEVIGYVEESGAASDGGNGAKKARAPRAASAGAQQPAPPAPAPEPAPAPPEPEPRVMPAAARAMAETGVDAAAVTPTGPGGRVLKEDVLRAVPEPKAPPAPEAPAPAPAGLQAEPAGTLEEVIPMTPIRQRIAERLVQAQQTAALLTTFNEVDMSRVIALRKEYQERFQQKYGVKLGFMSFFVKAAIEALKEFPAVNAEVRGQDIVYRNYYDIGIAVGGGKGLVVPVLRRAELMSFAEIEMAIADFGARAKQNKISLEELKGGTFSISNGGIYGSLLSTPIVNPPQSGILGLHAIQDRPVAVDGQVAVRPMMYIALTYDHRIVDGREAVTFLKRIKECIEDPARILVEV